jgi:hypothetical protein
MYPSERNILYRIKEIYHLKPKNWKNLITKLKSSDDSPFEFYNIIDPIVKQPSHAIYLKGVVWTSYESKKHSNLMGTDL